MRLASAVLLLAFVLVGCGEHGIVVIAPQEAACLRPMPPALLGTVSGVGGVLYWILEKRSPNNGGFQITGCAYARWAFRADFSLVKQDVIDGTFGSRNGTYDADSENHLVVRMDDLHDIAYEYEIIQGTDTTPTRLKLTDALGNVLTFYASGIAR